MLDQLKEIMLRYVDVDPDSITEDTLLAEDLGLDSFSLMSIMGEAEEELDPALCACILYTSGTTGKSKGVMLSHANLIDNAMCCDDEASSDDVMLMVLPIHHAYCLTCDLLLSLRYGTTLAINDTPMRLQQNLKLFKPTKLLLVPLVVETIYRRIKAEKRRNPLLPMKLIGRKVFGPQLDVIFCGGAYLAPELVAEIMVYTEDGQITAEAYPYLEHAKKAEQLFRKEVARINKVVPPAKRIVRLRLRDEEFEKTTSRKIKRIQTGPKGRLLD